MRRFFVIGLALAIILTKAIDAEAIEPSDAFVVKGIEYESLNGTARLDIETSDRVTYITYELESPYRIIIDPLDPIWCDYSETVYFDEGIVRSIRFVRGREISEGPGKPYYPFDFVSVELRSPYPYRLSEVDSIITLNIGKIAPPPKRESEFIPAESSGFPAEPEGITETMEWEIEEAAGSILAEDRIAVDTVEGKLLKEKKAIDIAKDELQKKRVFLEREGLKLAHERKLLEKDKEALKDKRVELKKRKFEPRPVKEYKDKPAEPDYLSKVLTLNGCIQIAVSNSLHVEAMNERVKLAKMKVNEAFRELFPEFTFMMDETSGMITNQHYKGRKLGFEFKQVIFHGGEQVYLWEQSKVNLKVAKENLQKTKEEIVFEATKTYYELAKAVNKYKHQEELLESINTDFNIAKKEHELELMSQIDFMNVGSSMNQASHTLVSYKNNISLAKLELKKTMNVDMRHDIKTDSELELKDVDVDLNECMDLALKYKPEYRVSYLNTEATKLAEKVAKSQEFPQVDIFAKYLKSAERLEPSHLLRRHLKNERALGATVSMPFGPHTFDYQYKRTKLAPTVTTFENDTRSRAHKMRLNLFDNMGRVSGIKDAEINYKEALNELNKSEQDIYTDLHESFYSLKEAKIKISNTLNNIELYNKELEVARIKKGLNEITFYDLIQAKVRLYGEKGSYADALGDYHIAVARINKAIGLGGYFK